MESSPPPLRAHPGRQGRQGRQETCRSRNSQPATEWFSRALCKRPATAHVRAVFPGRGDEAIASLKRRLSACAGDRMAIKADIAAPPPSTIQPRLVIPPALPKLLRRLDQIWGPKPWP